MNGEAHEVYEHLPFGTHVIVTAESQSHWHTTNAIFCPPYTLMERKATNNRLANGYRRGAGHVKLVKWSLCAEKTTTNHINDALKLI